MSDDFVIEEGSSTGSSSRRPFFIAVGALLLLLMLSSICAVSSLSGGLGLGGGNGDRTADNPAVQTRLAENAAIAVTNTAVAITIESMTVEAMTRAAMPTATLVPTNTPPPTATPLPTNTPVVIVQATQTEVPPVSGTTEFGGVAGTPTPISLTGGGTGSTGGTGLTGGTGTLPDTGFETIWGALLAAFVLIGVFFVARRLRSN